MDIFLDSKIITDNTLSSNAIAAYTALRMIQSYFSRGGESIMDNCSNC